MNSQNSRPTFKFTPLSGKARVTSVMRLAKTQEVVAVAGRDEQNPAQEVAQATPEPAPAPAYHRLSSPARASTRISLSCP